MGLITLGALRGERPRAERRGACRWSTTGSSRPRCSCSPARSSGARRPASFDALGGMARGQAGAGDGADDARASSRSPCPARRRSRASSLILAGVFRTRLGLGGRRRGRDGARGDVHAAADLRRAAHGRLGPSVFEAALDLRPAELGRRRPAGRAACSCCPRGPRPSPSARSPRRRRSRTRSGRGDEAGQLRAVQGAGGEGPVAVILLALAHPADRLDRPRAAAGPARRYRRDPRSPPCSSRAATGGSSPHPRALAGFAGARSSRGDPVRPDARHGVIADAIQRDRLGAFTAMIVAGSGILAIGTSYREPMSDDHIGEYYALLACGGAGMVFLVTASNLMTPLPRARVVLDLPLHPLRDRPAGSSVRSRPALGGLIWCAVFARPMLLFGSALGLRRHRWRLDVRPASQVAQQPGASDERSWSLRARDA